MNIKHLNNNTIRKWIWYDKSDNTGASINIQQMKAKIYKDKKGEFRWTIFASNGRKLANSGEGYKRLGACVKGLQKVSSGVSFKATYTSSKGDQQWYI